jgi:D-3-phosphoglycerate dehydrogenase
MAKVLVLDGLSNEGVDILRQEGFEVDVKPPQKPDELAQIIGEYDALVVRSATKVTRQVLQAAKKLKVVGRAGAGTDNIDSEAATEAGIIVMNTPGGNTISTCEHTFALLLALCRNIPAAHQSMVEGRWDRKKFMGTELYGKTLGVIGVGRVGGAVVKRALAFEMKVLAYDPILTPLKAESLGVELVGLDELLEKSDFISVHAPKTEKTNNLITLEKMKRMKRTCRIINCARGGIVNEADLAQALREGIIAGAAVDVYVNEPPEPNPFLGVPNIIMTPHLAASTEEAQLTVAVDIARQIADYLKTGAIVNAVNVPSLDPETRKMLQPLMFLAERLGEFVAHYADEPPQAIEVEYLGEMGVTDTYPVTAAILTGFLKPVVENVNMVSAPSQLKARGIECRERRSAEISAYAFEIGVKLVSAKGKEVAVRGTLFHRTDPRICSINGMRVDARPVGHMLVCENQDVPLILGRICTTLGENGVNIANLTLGREAPGGRALTVLNLDQPIGESLLAHIRALPHVLSAKVVSLPAEL